MPKRNSEATLHRREVNGVDLAWAEWGGEQSPVLLLAHAAGFHGRCWDQIVRHLDDYRVIAIDHRGHGRSDSNPPFTWEQFGRDIVELIVALDLREIVAVGHSLGGHCLIQAAARVPDRVSRLTLIDPVVFEPEVYEKAPSEPNLIDAIVRRRSTWDSPQQMIEKLRDRAPFSRWHPEVLRDYCEHGLVQNPNGYRLACAPQIEASIYMGAFDVDIIGCISKIEAPVTVVRAESKGHGVAEQDFSASPTWPGLANAFRRGRDIYIPEHTHFMPMENPRLIATIIQQADGHRSR